MNVYDFDKTIYRGDSTLDFYKYCLFHYPKVVRCFPCQIIAVMKYKLGRNDKTRFKEEFYCFLKEIKDVNNAVKSFWDKNEHKIKKWYIEQQKPDDVVISASPYFLLDEICNRKGIKTLIASNVNQYTGKYSGVNCYGEEKVRRFQKEIQESVENFYTDSMSDIPMMKLAQNSYLVKGDNKVMWRAEDYESI